EFAAPGAPPIEVGDLTITLINDPLPTLNFVATGKSDVAGELRVEGAWQRRTDDTVLSVRAGGIAVGPAVVRRLGAYWPDAQEHGRQLTGVAGVKAELAYHPGGRQPW